MLFSQLLAFQVIFMLSTIVFVTDCCSSRILLLKDRTSSAQRLMQEENYPSRDRDINKGSFLSSSAAPPISDNDLVDTINKTLMITFSLSGEDEIVESTAEPTPSIDFFESEFTSEDVLNITEKSLLDPGITTPKINDTDIGEIEFNASDFITDPSVRSKHAGDPKYHVIDVYYKIMRDVLSFECTGQFSTEFCLNKGRCFRYPIGNHSFYSCECADGYTGERCESKTVNGLYVPTPIIDMRRSKVLTARIVFSFPMLIAISVIYIAIGAIIVFKFSNEKCKVHCFR